MLRDVLNHVTMRLYGARQEDLDLIVWEQKRRIARRRLARLRYEAELIKKGQG